MAAPKLPDPARHSVYKRIRVRREDAAFLYFTLESYEGIASYSTIPAANPADAYRDLELRIPPDFVSEVQNLLSRLGGMVHEL